MPNGGPENSDPGADEPGSEARRRNPSSAYRGETTDDVTAATVRAHAVTRRFGGARHALTRPDRPDTSAPPVVEDDSEVPD